MDNRNLEDIRKEIDEANTLLVRAGERVLSLRQQYSKKVKELKDLGIDNPKSIENEIKKREMEINELTQQIKDSIPSEIVKKYSKVNFDTITEEMPDLDQPF